ncbi:pentatricopeptide repeat-containing protein At3g61520, mitochondrial-like isoform X2 [Salvia splendens]|uniref:pentatricopeptide repeat-containing protein At3g61520, mitochondrial-like isoform X2 n=1 Tax=Salvia splendens TaxID=180675 RepID=UPI001C25AF6E|nr:pentatricopeptide repeat-containing protein At3g61520, mitochondrial-like isoform X2 [Salvia splendens]
MRSCAVARQPIAEVRQAPQFPAMRLSLKPPAAATLRRFSPTADPSCPISETLSLLQTSDPISWPANFKLGDLLSAVSPQSLLKITRQLPTSQNALQFFEYLKSSPHLSDSVPFAFQGVLELFMRENPNSPGKLYELFAMAKEQNTPLSVNAGTLLIICFSNANMLEEMVMVLDAIETRVRNTHVVNLVVFGLFNLGRFPAALKLVDKMLQPGATNPPNDRTLRIVFSSILGRKYRGGDLRDEEIYHLFLRFSENGLCLGGYWLTHMISRFCRNGDCNKAWNALQKAMYSGSHVEVIPCNFLLSKLGQQRDYVRMNLLMNEMKEKGITPTVVTYGIMIRNLCKIRRLDEALEVLEKMRDGEVGIKPDVVIYNTLIDGLCKVGREEDGLRLMERMRSSETKCEPNTVTYNCLIDGFCKVGDIDTARELFEQMSNLDEGVNIVSLNAMLGGMCRVGRVSSAMELFSRMREKGLEGNTVTYTALITAFCGANNIEKAMDLFNGMKENGCNPDAIIYYTLISGFTRAGRMNDAMEIKSKMEEAGFSLDRIGYNIMIGGFCRKNKIGNASELLTEMQIAGLNPDRVTYNTLISYFCDKGDFKHAQKVMKKMVDDGLSPTVVTYGALIQGYCLKGSLSAAMRLFADMKSTSKVLPNTVIYNILIDSHCKEDYVEGALSLMDEMRDRGVKMNNTTYNALFKGLQQRNWSKKALQLMKQMSKQECVPDYVTMEILTEWLSAAGETEKLKEFVRSYRDCAELRHSGQLLWQRYRV